MDIEEKWNIDGIASVIFEEMNEYQADLNDFEDYWRSEAYYALQSKGVEQSDISIIKGLVQKSLEKMFEDAS